jgi:hypothetical protein
MIQQPNECGLPKSQQARGMADESRKKNAETSGLIRRERFQDTGDPMVGSKIYESRWVTTPHTLRSKFVSSANHILDNVVLLKGTTAMV